MPNATVRPHHENTRDQAYFQQLVRTRKPAKLSRSGVERGGRGGRSGSPDHSVVAPPRDTHVSAPSTTTKTAQRSTSVSIHPSIQSLPVSVPVPVPVYRY